MLHKHYISKFVFSVLAAATTERHGVRRRMESFGTLFVGVILHGELSTMQRKTNIISTIIINLES